MTRVSLNGARRLLVALWLCMLAGPLAARDVSGLYNASVAVKDRSPAERSRASAAALAEVLVKLTGMDAVYVEDKCDDLYAAISHAVERASWASVRRIRHIKLNRKGHHQGRNFGLEGLEPG